ncbi:MAG: serine/threonine-protein kinase [Planctomycetota bacterium]
MHAAAEDHSTAGGSAKFTYAADETPLAGYRLTRPIHRGGFGEVYEAVSDGGKQVALKLLHSHTEIELRGARECLNLDHPNLVTIYDIRRDDGGDWWIVMEYVPGERLSEVLDRGPMTPEQALHWLDGIASAVDYLHTRGLVHRDLKPANIFERDGVVKVGDVGLAKFLKENKRSGHTRSVGTVHYMAPEVGRGKYGPGVDVYALGVMLTEMLTGKLPFDGESVAEILMRHLTEEPDLSAVGPRFRDVIARSLEKDPAKRTPSCLVLRDDFRDTLGGSVASATGGVGDAFRATKNVLDRADRTASEFLRGHRVSRDGDVTAAAGTPGDGVGWGLFQAAWITLMVVCFAYPQLLGISRPLGIAGGIFLAIAHHHVHESRKRERKLAKKDSRRGRAAEPVVRAVAAPPGVETRRAVPWNRRLADVVGGSVTATLLAAFFGFVTLAVAGELDEPTALPFLTASTAVAATLLIASAKFFEGGSRGPGRRIAAVVGAVVSAGFVAGLSEGLLGGDAVVDLDGAWKNIEGEERFVGPLLFLGALAFVPRWWRLVDPYRKKRFRLWPVAWIGLFGLLTTGILGDPEPAPMFWAFVLPAVVQLSAPWTPAEERTAAAKKVEVA